MKHSHAKRILTADGYNRPRGKRKKKERQPYVWEGHCCPFCKAELPLVKEKVKGLARLALIFTPRASECSCGAFEVPSCPACKRETWYKDKIHRHNKPYGCGFEGEKKR